MADRFSLMLEADRRGLLSPEQKVLLDEAVKRGLVQADKPAVVSAGETIRQIPRQVGLTARYGAEGVADVAGIVTEPIRAMLNPALRAVGLPVAPSLRSTVSGWLDYAGLPTPQGPTERVVGDVTRLMAGGGGLSGAAGKVSELVSGPVAKTVSTTLAANPGTQVATLAGAGAAGGSVREAGGGPTEQFIASLAGGLTAGGLVALGTKTYDVLAKSVQNLMAPKNDLTQINVVLNQILERNGVKVSQLPGAVRNELAIEVKKALDTGKELNPDVIRRLADYGAVGGTPTKGTTTLDPVQITQERNLAKIGANSRDPRLQELSRIQNENNAKLIEGLNKMGADTPNANPVVAGEQAQGVIRARDASARATEKALYAKARDSAGRAIELDREGFVFDAYNRLADSNKGAFLPENIKTILDQLKSGKVTMGGKEFPAPFTVDTIDNLKTMLSTASRGAQDGNVRAAIAQVRNALEAAKPKAVGRPVGGNQVVDPNALSAAQGQADDVSAAAMGAFDKARRFSRARHDWQESAEGIRAALDDVPADRFVKDYILSSGNKAATAEVERMLFTIRKDPQAMQAVKENVVSFLKSKALGNAADEVGNFSAAGFNRALKEFGDQKLKLFFTNEEISQLKALGRVASYETVQPRGSAVNNSNTAGAVVGVLDRIASSPLIGRIPFGDAALRQPAQNWSAQISAKNALTPYKGLTKLPEKQPMGSVQDLVGPGLLLAAPRTNGRNDDKRNQRAK